ncbi:MAG: hypothetical protein AUJ97_08490 [Bacteroidetes bacterium CG2_30_32_10]|nr:MAG: hypothetical protein AUJ97_08490 [Bacteroidetes bacterium CG2_30_32_10]
MKKLLLICFVALFGMQFANAQTTITGKVTNMKDKTPIVGAVITAKSNTAITAVSGPDGSYTITIPSNVKNLDATYTGMQKKTQGIGKKKVVNFQMMPVNNNKKQENTKKDNSKKDSNKKDASK